MVSMRFRGSLFDRRGDGDVGWPPELRQIKVNVVESLGQMKRREDLVLLEPDLQPDAAVINHFLGSEAVRTLVRCS